MTAAASCFVFRLTIGLSHWIIVIVVCMVLEISTPKMAIDFIRRNTVSSAMLVFGEIAADINLCDVPIFLVIAY